MYDYLFSTDSDQALRMQRHLTATFGLFAFTLASFYFFYIDLYFIDRDTFLGITAFFWSGFLLITFAIRSGLNQKAADPSLTTQQLLWVTTYLLTICFVLNEWRSLILMQYFGMLSFGFFKLRFREFLTAVLFAILGYTLIILYLFTYEPARIMIELELLNLLVFTGTTLIMLFTGSSVNHLRERSKEQYEALQYALELNKTLATTDELTGLFNRRYFMEKLTQQKALSERDDSDFVVCFFDLDHFKQINDTFGHHTGDIVLQKFSEIVQSSIREIDYASRFGGEEFVCLLVSTDVENAIKVTERIRQSLESYNFNDIAPSLHSTVSVGIANFKEFNTIQETLTSADHRMYVAKKNGRNKVVFNDDESD